MRPFENLLVITTLLFWITLIVRLPRRWAQGVALASLFALGLHLLIEGSRWQLVGIYTLALILLLIFIAQRLRSPTPSDQRSRRSVWRMLLGSLMAVILITILIAPALIAPIPTMPAPDGPYPVGTFTQMLVDESRLEQFSDNPNEPRRVLIQVWYPAENVAGLSQAPWLPEAEYVAPALARFFGLPTFTTGHLRYVKMPSYLDAPMASNDAPYPVLLFSHGWYGFRSQSSFLMHALASHGYVVVAVEHPYGSACTVFPDGRVAEINHAALPLDAPEEELERAAQRVGQQWAGDLSFVLDELTRMNAADGVFQGRLDLSRVGAIGHSNGGGAIIEFCGSDPRCQAGLGLDIWMMPVTTERRQAGLQQPFLFMFRETNPDPAMERRFNELISESPAALRMTIIGSNHLDYTDLPVFLPILGKLGIEGKRVFTIITTYALAFFDREFKGIPTTLFDGPSFDFPEVILWLSL